MSVNDGERYYDPHAEKEFVVVDAPDTFGLSTMECDQLQVWIEYDDGETMSVPHERFSGLSTYEKVAT